MTDKVDAYLQTVARLEPDITPIDHDAAMASIAISLKRIADLLEVLTKIGQKWAEPSMTVNKPNEQFDAYTSEQYMDR